MTELTTAIVIILLAASLVVDSMALRETKRRQRAIRELFNGKGKRKRANPK